MSSRSARHPENTSQPVSGFGFDEFEIGFLPVIRHLVTSIQKPESHGWQKAYKIAAERWGETFGLSVAYSLAKVSQTILEARSDYLCINDPLDLAARSHLTGHEAAFIGMIHHMRRDNTMAARMAIDVLTPKRMDPYVIRSALSFAHRFPIGNLTELQITPPAILRLVD